MCIFCILHFSTKRRKKNQPKIQRKQRNGKKRRKYGKKNSFMHYNAMYTKQLGTTQSTRSTENCDESTVKYIRFWFGIKLNVRMKTNTKYYYLTNAHKKWTLVSCIQYSAFGIHYGYLRNFYGSFNPNKSQPVN